MNNHDQVLPDLYSLELSADGPQTAGVVIFTVSDSR